VTRFVEQWGRPAGLPDWPRWNGLSLSLSLSSLFLLFSAAKYQSSLYLVQSLAPAIGASRSNIKREDYGNFSVANIISS
jgi:hypothetical protein